MAAFGYVVWQRHQQTKFQTNFIQSANTSYGDDARYISFGANYVFAIPKSFGVDESSINGVQLLLPAEGNIKVNKLDQLYDVGGVAVQPITDVKASDNAGLKNYVLKSLVPDLKKSLSQAVTTTFSRPGKYERATIVVKKDGKQVRQIYAYGGPRPFLVVAQGSSDAFNEVTTTLVTANNYKAKDDIESIKKAVTSIVTLLQQGKVQALYDNGSSLFKEKTSPTSLANTVDASSSYLHRNIVVLGGSLQNNKFIAQLYFPPVAKDELPSVGLVSLQKENNTWKAAGFSLPHKA